MFLLELPLVLRALCVLATGLILGGQINRAIYGFAVFSRRISPWAPPEPNAPPRRWSDRIPVFGWLGLRREASIHGSGFWVRPLLIELFTGVGLMLLYIAEVQGWLISPRVAISLENPQVVAMLHWQFLAHAVLIVLMLPATFIDFDEQTIPDEITVPGMLLGLVLTTAFPATRLLTLALNGAGFISLEPLLLTSPQREMILPLAHSSVTVTGMGPPVWPAWLNGPWGLWLALACLLGYCFALLDRRWITRRGVSKAVQYFFIRMVRRNGIWWKSLTLAVVGSAAVSGVWLLGGTPWQGLLSSLVGMACGGGIVWCVRLLGYWSLGREAMGFGDVTLMAMIGAFVGWQGALLVFLLAPFMALFIAVAQLLLTRKTEIAFGPYLCLAALVLVLGWRTIWEEAAKNYFEMGWTIPLLLIASLPLMAVMLWVWRQVKLALGIG